MKCSLCVLLSETKHTQITKKHHVKVFGCILNVSLFFLSISSFYCKKNLGRTNQE